LSDNGGSTPTVALRDAADNPALAGADPADAPATDQRGVARPLPASTAPDIGAFELDQTTGGGEILGTARADTLRGTAAADVIRGLAGDDLLKGLAGDDRLYGDGGDDRLQGNQGVDLLTGGRGCDRFVYRSLADAPASGPGYDEILDFSRPEHDRIDVSPLDAKTDVAGNQAFAFVRQVEFSAAGQLRYEAAADGGFLVEGNVDRNLDADFAFVVHTDLASLKASDFLL
jgi:Ca2+-binding RTX toxin-like protein